MEVSVQLEEDSGHSHCRIVLFSQLQNASEVQQLILKGQVEASLIKPEVVVAPMQVMVAANKAVRARAAKNMKTRSIYTEIIYNLSPGKKISDSLKTFGLGEEDKEVLAVVVGSEEEMEAKTKKITGQLKGTVTPMSELSNLVQMSRVREIYKLTPEEMKLGVPLNGVLSRMACKEFLTL